jgi:hypothetical protein
VFHTSDLELLDHLKIFFFSFHRKEHECSLLNIIISFKEGVKSPGRNLHVRRKETTPDAGGELSEKITGGSDQGRRATDQHLAVVQSGAGHATEPRRRGRFFGGGSRRVPCC